jgi:exodeoxyribonuclease V alpha subunit
MSLELNPAGTARAWAQEPRSHDVALFEKLREAASRLDLHATDALLAWEVVRTMRKAGGTTQELGGELLLKLRRVVKDGGTRMRVDNEALERLRSLPHENPVVGPAGTRRPLLHTGSYLCVQKFHALEARVAVLVRQRWALPPHHEEKCIHGAWRDLSANAGLKLTVRQQQAVMRAASQALTVVAGGPGTGKTSVVGSLMRLMVRLGVPPECIHLAAPTGKAAHRLAETLAAQFSVINHPSLDDEMLRRACPQPQTLHRLLGYSPSEDRFRHHEGAPLHTRAVIVDEASMVDLAMMDQLLRATPPNARLVLLGDPHQLPPVEPGSVLHDIMTQERATVVLQESHRMDATQSAGAHIIGVATKIRHGSHGQLFSGTGHTLRVCQGVPDVRWEGAELLRPCSDGDVDQLLDAWFKRFIVSGAALQRMTRTRMLTTSGLAILDLADVVALHHQLMSARLLCALRHGPRGTHAINAKLQELLASALGLAPDHQGLLPGTPVVMERNDYALNLFNGDQGVCVRVQGGSRDGHVRLAVAFPRGQVAVDVFELDTLRGGAALGHAVTVHRAQGSEYYGVTLILPKDDAPRLLTRELLYTALTRGRHSALVVGHPELVMRAVARGVQRDGGLAEMLQVPDQI